MAGWLIVLAVLSCLVILLLWMPIILFIDTATNRYYIRLKGLATASLLSDPKELILIRLKVLFFHFTLHPTQWKRASRKQLNAKAAKKKRASKFGPANARALLRSFRTRRFLLDLDSGDYVLNAQLYPVFMALNQIGGQWRINFQNRNRLLLQLENRPVRILKAIINP